ncbi:MAG: ArsA family ATPase [Bacteroidales bacterium]|nr:ArsA family ATPase [Bacteroidales bacterium]
MKTIFFTGKGGVGKSTLSSAVAWQLAEIGLRVLAVSFDPAHNLGDIYHVKLGHRKKQFGKTNLYLQEMDLEKSAAEYMKANMSILQEVYSYLTAFNMDSYFDILKYSPGVEEFAALTSMQKILEEEEHNFDFIVFDTPPTGLTLRILALPRITVAWIDRLIRIRREILEKRYTIHKLKGKYSEEGHKLAYKESDDNVIKKLYVMRDRYKGVETHIQGEDNRICVVFNPDYLSLRESERLLDGIHELQLPIDTIFHNKLADPESDAARRVEDAMLKKYPRLRIERVPLIDHTEPACYIMDKDLTGVFTRSKTHAE